MPEILSYGFMQRALLTGTVLALFSGIISVFIVLRRISFLGSGLSHAAFGGVAIGFYFGVNPLMTAFLYSVVVAFGIEGISSRGRLAEDTAIGILFAFSMALGVVLIGLAESYTIDLFGYLFGSILAITDEDAFIAAGLSLSLTAAVLLIMKELHFITFSEELAAVSGIRVRFVKSVFLVSMAVAIVVGIKLVGIILISALLVIPGAMAHQLTRDFRTMIALSCLVALFSTISGIMTAYWLNLAPGGTIVLVMALLFFLSLLRRKY